MKEKRTRNWSTIIYPPTGVEGEETTCPEDWKEILGEMAVKCAVSPLHDRDVKEVTSDGEVVYKKAHRHVVVAFDGVKTEAQARELFKRIGGVGCEPVNSLYAMTRYLTHMDDPDKAQYSTLDVLTFGGYEYKRYGTTRDDEERQIVANMGRIFNLCAEKVMYDFADTAEYLMVNDPELFTTFRKNPYFFATFFKSKQNLAKMCYSQEEYLTILNSTTPNSLQNPHYETLDSDTNDTNEQQGGDDETAVQDKGNQ